MSLDAERSLKHLLVAGLLAFHVAAAPASEGGNEARQLLERMAVAAHRLNYEGTFIYVHDGHLQTMRIIHAATPEGERERLVSLNGPSREVIRDNDQVTCIFPDEQSVRVEKSGAVRPLPIALPTRLEALEQQYSVGLAGGDRIAGRAARKIVIEPRDGYRYGHNIWVDIRTGLLLRSELTERSNVVEQLVFTALSELESVEPTLLEPENGGSNFVRYEPAELEISSSDFGRWQVEELPAGFQPETRGRHRLPNRQPVEHHIYSDGLASVSVFIERLQDLAEGELGQTRVGAVNAYGRLVDGHRVTVIGEVPAQTVKLIGDSLRRNER